MIRVALLVWLALMTGPALGQVVPVRSGAHDGFDRLALDLPGRIDLRVETHEGGATVIFDDPSLRFDTAAVFARIGRTRLRELSVPGGQGRLALDLACECEVRPFWHGASMLVLDIADPPGPPIRSIAKIRPPAGRGAGAVVLPGRIPSPATIPLAAMIPLAAEIPSPAAGALAARLAEGVAEESAGAPGPARDVPAQATATPDLSGMRSLLLHQLGRAASQGLVSVAPRAGPTIRPAPVASAEPSSPGVPDQGPPAQHLAPADRIALNAHTSMDRDLADARRAADAPSPAHAACPAPATLDVPSWGGRADLPMEMGQVYRRLFAEFDTIDAEAARALARLYIHHGFGAEAGQVLALGAPDDPEARLLGELALLVDHASLPDSAILRHSAGCGEPAVLWSLLAQTEPAADIVFDHRALQRAFAALPSGLRRSLGPGLVRWLLAAGHVGTADHLQRLIDRVASPDEAEVLLARAELAARRSGPDEATLALAGRSNTLHAAEALAGTIENAVARGAPVSVEQAQLAGAYAFELRDTEIGDRLAAAHVNALAAAGAFDEAAAAFARLGLEHERPAAMAIATSLMAEITRNADDVTFLRHALSDRFLPRESFAPALAGAIARRLLEVGFAEAADSYLRSAEADPALRLLRAEIAVARQRPGEAELSLLPLEGPETDRLRARARMMRGDHATAHALFVEGKAVPEADRAAFLAGDPDALATAADPLLRGLSRILQDRPDPDPEDSATALIRSQGALQEAVETRRMLARLLAGMPGPESEGR